MAPRAALDAQRNQGLVIRDSNGQRESKNKGFCISLPLPAVNLG
jgi:hypothetical protein